MSVSQKNSILKHFVEHGSLTTVEAFELYGCTSLRARVSDFKKQGHKFSKKMCVFVNRYGNKGQHARYYYEGRDDG